MCSAINQSLNVTTVHPRHLANNQHHHGYAGHDLTDFITLQQMKWCTVHERHEGHQVVHVQRCPLVCFDSCFFMLHTYACLHGYMLHVRLSATWCRTALRDFLSQIPKHSVSSEIRFMVMISNISFQTHCIVMLWEINLYSITEYSMWMVWIFQFADFTCHSEHCVVIW